MLTRRGVAAACRHHEARCAFGADVHAELAQQVERDVDVGAGNQFPHHFDHHVLGLCHQRQRQQQRGQELAGDIAPDPDRCVQRQAVLSAITQPQRRVALLCQALDGAAQLAQGVDQVADRALVHARDAAEFKMGTLGAGQQGQCSRERAHGGAGIAQKQGRFA